MTSHQLARRLHRIWGQIQHLHLESAELLDQLVADDPARRLALELALHDLLALSARAASLATFVEAFRRARRSRKKT